MTKRTPYELWQAYLQDKLYQPIDPLVPELRQILGERENSHKVQSTKKLKYS